MFKIHHQLSEYWYTYQSITDMLYSTLVFYNNNHDDSNHSVDLVENTWSTIWQDYKSN